MHNVAYNADCLPAMRAMRNNAFKWGVIDIPYGINVAKMPYLKETQTKVKQRNGNLLNGNGAKRGYTLKDWDKSPPTQEYFDQICRVTTNQIIFGIEYTNWQGVGPGRIKWDKGQADGVSFGRYETAYCSSIENTIVVPLLWAGMNQAKSLAEPMVMQGNKRLNEKRIHPTHKPVLLYKCLYNQLLQPGESIIDTHLGGGSSRIAAYDMGFDFEGYEIDPEYFALHTKRFALHIQQQSLFIK